LPQWKAKGGDDLCASDLKTKDRLRARLPAFNRRVARAAEIVRRGLALCARPYVAFSGGKDSEVVLHLVVQQKPDVDVVWLHQGAEFPDTEELVYRLAREWNLNLHVVHVKPGLLELLEEYGAYGLPVRTPYRQGDVTRRLIREPSLRVAKEFGFDGVFMGLRKEESRTRKITLAVNGELHLAKYDGLWHVNPLADWSGEDVWAYINGLGLPYNAVYDKTRFQPREWIRTTPWAGGTGKEEGRFQFLKYYYPELFDEFARRFPNVRSYV
jgi:phosphoadenosine phosphosulfate reductase